jgi:CheY-like chemotaxis protein
MDATRAPILVVDDLADAADSQVALLQLWGHEAAAYYDGPSALTAARARPPSAALVDIVMPGMDGFQFAARLRALPGCADIPVIAITGRTDSSCHPMARASVIDRFLLKPIDPDGLERLLRWHLGMPGVTDKRDVHLRAVPVERTWLLAGAATALGGRAPCPAIGEM